MLRRPQIVKRFWPRQTYAPDNGSWPLLVMSRMAWWIAYISTRETHAVNREHAYAGAYPLLLSMTGMLHLFRLDRMLRGLCIDP
jgi:hypothetical protein